MTTLPDPELRAPIILGGRYLLEARQATGGMAEVFRAQDQTLERTVAIKILRKDFSSSAEFRDRFRQEAKAAANLSHPNIVTVHDFGLDRDQLFIVMEYIPGTDLKTILKRRRLSFDEAISLIVQACAGIGYAQRAGLVHCDIKPQNMLVTPDMRLKVTDFGIARALSSITPDERAEIVWGSPQYFSPEQAAGGPPSPASDVYSLGVVLFEMLTGQPPFEADTSAELARMHREVLPPSPSRLNPDIPPAIERILLKVLSKEPSSRYRTADQMGRVLVTFTQKPGIESISTMPPIASVQRDEPPSAPGTSPNHVKKPVTPPRAAAGGVGRKNTPRSIQSGPAIDWITWLLAILVLIMVVGLVPFWFWVFYMINPPLG